MTSPEPFIVYDDELLTIKMLIEDDDEHPAEILKIVQDCLSRPVSAAGSTEVLDKLPHMSSTDLLLIAHDEWKRREERKHNHEESGWIAGWINGFMTSKKWAQEKVKELRQQGEREQ